MTRWWIAKDWSFVFMLNARELYVAVWKVRFEWHWYEPGKRKS